MRLMANTFSMVGLGQEKLDCQHLRFEFLSTTFAKLMAKGLIFSWLETKKTVDLDSKKVEIKDNLLQLKNSKIIRFELTVRTRARKCASKGMIIIYGLYHNFYDFFRKGLYIESQKYQDTITMTSLTSAESSSRTEIRSNRPTEDETNDTSDFSCKDLEVLTAYQKTLCEGEGNCRTKLDFENCTPNCRNYDRLSNLFDKS